MPVWTGLSMDGKTVKNLYINPRTMSWVMVDNTIQEGDKVQACIVETGSFYEFPLGSPTF